MSKRLIAVALVVVGGLGWVGVRGAKAADEMKQQVVVVGTGEVINHDYLTAGERVEVFGTVNGDVYVAGGEVRVDGKISGDLLAVGGMVNISGEVSGNVRAVGGQMIVTGKVGRNVSVAGGSVELTEGAEVGGNVVAGAGNLTLASPVDGDVVAGAGNLTISNQVGGNVEAAVGTLRLTPKAVVSESLIYWSDEDASVAEGAVVKGETEHKTAIAAARVRVSTEELAKAWVQIRTVGRVIGLLSLLLLGGLMVYLAPGYTERGVGLLKSRTAAALGWGFLSLILVPVAVLILLVTVIGAPLGLILLAGYLIALYTARLWVILWAGGEIVKRGGRKGKWGWALVVGMVVYFVATWLPIVGGLVGMVALILGLGVCAMSLRQVYSKARGKKTI